MSRRFTADNAAITYVIGAHNSAKVIEATLTAIAERLYGRPSEIIVVENGSTDDTSDVLSKCVKEWDSPFTELRVVVSEKGLGSAWRVGVAVSSGDIVVLTADDLPFGFDDLDAAAEHDFQSSPVLIGSKCHPDSVLQRSASRRIATEGFRLLRRVILGIGTGDPQGTYVLHGPWIRSLNSDLREPGFLMSTELAYAAESHGLKPVETPVRLRRAPQDSGQSRVGLSDAWVMGWGLWRLRRRKAALSAAAQRATAWLQEAEVPALPKTTSAQESTPAPETVAFVPEAVA